MDTFKRLIAVCLFSVFAFVSFPSYSFGPADASVQTIFTANCKGRGTREGNSFIDAAAKCLPLFSTTGEMFLECVRSTKHTFSISGILSQTATSAVVGLDQHIEYRPTCNNGATVGVAHATVAGGQVDVTMSRASRCEANSANVTEGVCECLQGYRPRVPGRSGDCIPYSCPVKGSYSSVTQPDFKIDNPGVQCLDGCNVNPASVKSAPDGSLYMSWPYRYTGDSCGGKKGADGVGTGETGSPAPAQCPAQQCPGTINGTHVCVPCASTSIPGASTSASGAAAGNTTPGGPNLPDGGTATTNTVCNQSTCTTTTTVTDKNGTVVGTASQEKPKENFCQENPGLQICKEGRWGGNCGGGYTCDGDAVQCAMAREIHKRNCQLYDTPNALSEAGDAAMNSQAQPDGHPLKGLESQSFGSLFRPQEGAASCLVDKTVSVAGKSAVIPFSKLCDPLRWMGHMAFAFSLLHAGFFVFRKF